MQNATMTAKQAWELIGGLGTPSKMPCFSWSISARKCLVGAKLRKIKNSICEGCYAFRGNYNFPVVVNAQEKRLDAAENNPQWVEAMVIAIQANNQTNYFRFFDSGDLQSTKMFSDICEIAKALPKIKFWLPTKEYGMVSEYVESGGVIPKNLNVRLSAYIVDGLLPTALAKRLGCTTSGVTVESKAVTCPSLKQGNKCLDCRRCWNRKVENVNYSKH